MVHSFLDAVAHHYSVLANVGLVAKGTDGTSVGFGDAIVQSFFLVGIAELFDKTWFVALLMALKYDKFSVLVGCFVALALHVIIAAVFGYTISRILPIQMLHFAAAGLYFVFAILYLKDWYESDPDEDIIEAGKEEAGDVLPTEDKMYGATSTANTYGQKTKAKMFGAKWKALSASFVAVFIAEWGDRTQIAMVGQHASQPLIPVCLGSMLAFLLLTISAVLTGYLLGNAKLSAKTVHILSSVSFFIFAALAVYDGLTEDPVDIKRARISGFTSR